MGVTGVWSHHWIVYRTIPSESGHYYGPKLLNLKITASTIKSKHETQPFVFVFEVGTGSAGVGSGQAGAGKLGIYYAERGKITHSENILFLQSASIIYCRGSWPCGKRTKQKPFFDSCVFETIATLSSSQSLQLRRGLQGLRFN